MIAIFEGANMKNEFRPTAIPLIACDPYFSIWSFAAYTKLDWMLWTTVLTDDREYLNDILTAILNMCSDSVDRVPLTDWYFTNTARQRGFQARSVVGGFYINLLAEKLLNK